MRAETAEVVADTREIIRRSIDLVAGIRSARTTDVPGGGPTSSGTVGW
jgi:hypothetical protein